MALKPPPNLKRLRDYYSYNKRTGEFRYKADKELAGFKRKDGYWAIFFEGVSYLGHRLAWYYVTGEYPIEVDHKDGCRWHNWYANLRPCTRTQNNGNSRGWGKKKKSGLPRGVFKHPVVSGKFRAQIFINYKAVHLGVFDTIAEAEKAYKEAAKQHFGEFAA